MKQLLYKLIYHPVINRALRFLNKLLLPALPQSLKLPPSGVVRVKLKHAGFKFHTNQTNYTSQLLFWRGPYAIEYTVIFEELIRNCECFYDIGAHAGYYSLVAAACNPGIRVVAFEPAPGPFHYLVKNVEKNNFGSTIKPYPVALGNHNGSADFFEATHSKYKYLQHNLIAESNLSVQQPGRTMKKITVAIATLDHFIQTNNIPFPDILKMDTEGTENLILEGAQEVLKKRPIVICETLFNKIERQLEAIFKREGFLFYNFKDNKLHRIDTLSRDVDNGVHDCFFVHPDKLHLISPFIQTP